MADPTSTFLQPHRFAGGRMLTVDDFPDPPGPGGAILFEFQIPAKRYGVIWAIKQHAAGVDYPIGIAGPPAGTGQADINWNLQIGSRNVAPWQNQRSIVNSTLLAGYTMDSIRVEPRQRILFTIEFNTANIDVVELGGFLWGAHFADFEYIGRFGPQSQFMNPFDRGP